jgi:hypothetical protein
MNKPIFSFSWFLIVVLSFCLLTNLSAQYKKFKTEISLGFNGGKNVSMVYFKPAVDQSYLLGNQYGLIMRLVSEKNLGFQTEINYAQKGWEDLSGQYARQMNYLEIPFMTHIYAGRKNRFFLNLGPKFGYLIDEKTLFNTNSTNSYRHTEATANKLDYGFSGGFGLSFQIKKQILQIETRASYSISNFFQDDLRGYYDNSNHLNASVTLGWLFRIK